MFEDYLVLRQRSNEWHRRCIRSVIVMYDWKVVVAIVKPTVDCNCIPM